MVLVVAVGGVWAQVELLKERNVYLHIFVSQKPCRECIHILRVTTDCNEQMKIKKNSNNDNTRIGAYFF